MNLKKLEVWFVVGSQDLYGPETLAQVAVHAQKMASSFDKNKSIPVSIVYKPIVKSNEEIYNTCLAANAEKNCIGIITWMHTFSPAKMWINGLKILHKPLLHLHTQFNRDIPWSSIDMDFMNLNQSAHGDREFGFIMSRMRINRKVVVGHWQNVAVVQQISDWCRAAIGWQHWQNAKYVRFGDNMREVAVTDGDKVAAQIQFGYSVNTYGVGDLVAVINKVKPADIDALCATYDKEYKLVASLKKGGKQHQSLREAAKIELGLRSFLEAGNYKGFTDTFEDLHGMVQLPGLPTQRLMADGYGFGGEGDWKTSALLSAMKAMAVGLTGGNSFMEDYTYHFEPKNNLVLGAHMLEICPSISTEKPSCEIHTLGIGGKADPVRLVFNGSAGNALNASLIDMGNRFRLLINTVKAVKPTKALPKLPVARILWKPMPTMETACAAWILAGGAHHTVYSQNISVDCLKTFAEMANIESVVIDDKTDIDNLKINLQCREVYYK